MPRTCWAASRGGCSKKMSGEHVFSESVFVNQVLSVHGLARIPEPRISLANLKAKVLCTTHNRQLSDLDSEAKKLSDALRQHTRAASPEHAYVEVDGWKLERWCLKCGHNLLASRWLGDRPFSPDPEMVKAVFGERQLMADAGLFIVKKPEISTNPGGDRVGWSVFNDSTNDAAIRGFYFQLQGLGLIVTPRSGDPTPALRSANLSANALDWSQTELSHRPKSIDLSFARDNWESHERAVLTIEFAW